MAEMCCVIIAFILHVVFRINFFFDVPIAAYSVGPIPGVIIVTAVAVALVELKLLPAKCKGLPYMMVIEVTLETTLSLITIEIAMMLWSRMELIAAAFLMKALQVAYGREIALRLTIGILSTAASQFLVFVLMATGRVDNFWIHRLLRRVCSPSSNDIVSCATSTTPSAMVLYTRPSAEHPRSAPVTSNAIAAGKHRSKAIIATSAGGVSHQICDPSQGDSRQGFMISDGYTLTETTVNSQTRTIRKD